MEQTARDQCHLQFVSVENVTDYTADALTSYDVHAQTECSSSHTDTESFHHTTDNKISTINQLD
jgi:hypothetical protein